MMNTQNIRKEFPLTQQQVPVLTKEGWVDGNLVFLDSGASTPMAKFLQEELAHIYNTVYSNVHRGAHYPSRVTTALFEEAREQVVDFLGGNHNTHEVIFGYNTTDVLTLAAHVTAHLDGVVLTTDIEHHSNYLPFLRYSDVDFVGVDEHGVLNMESLEQKLKAQKVKLVAVSGCSNVTGHFVDLQRVSALAHEHGALLLVDGAQLTAHGVVDVEAMGIDFFAGAGHKFYAPGSAFLYGPRDVMNAAEPYKPGGGTVNYVIDSERIGYRMVPDRHEGGTPHIVGAIVMAHALQWMKQIGMDEIRAHELELLQYAWKRLSAIKGVTLYGTDNLEQRAGVLSFNIDGVHDSLTAAILNYEGGIAVRNGCHCAHRYVAQLMDVTPAHMDRVAALTAKRECTALSEEEHTQIPGTARAVIAIFTSKEEMEHFVNMVERIARKEWIGTYEYADGEYLPKEWADIDLSQWPELAPMAKEVS